ncbi:MAG: AraC family transcriptional regulator [Pseudomonadota bacterium]
MNGMDELVMNWRSALIGLIMGCSMIALFYLYRRGLDRSAVGWLAVFVIAANVSAIPMLIGFAGAYDIWPGLTFLPTQTALLLGPAIALHGRALMVGGSTRRFWWLFLPGTAYLLYQLWAFTMLGDYRAKWAFNDAVHEPVIFPLAMASATIMIAVSLVYVWRLRSQYLEWLKHNRSDDDRFSPAWVTHLVVLVALAGVFWAAEVTADQLFGFTYSQIFLWDFIALFAIFIITLEALAGIDRPFPKMRSEEDKLREDDPVPTERDWVLEGARLKAKVLEERWHLEPGLSLQVLSRRFGTNQAYLSRTINQGLGENFSTFINGLRVDHAKLLIERDTQSMIDIALSAGFGSKASFNRAFKQHTGQSPSDYRRAKIAV